MRARAREGIFPGGDWKIKGMLSERVGKRLKRAQVVLKY